MRTLTDHKLNGLNESIDIVVVDQPGHGGACHKYELRLMAAPSEGIIGEKSVFQIHFQNGPIQEHGVNGVSQEALCAVLIDRLRSFQEGPFNCRENAIALTHFEDALMWLQKRTRDRLARGVEGTSKQ